MQIDIRIVPRRGKEPGLDRAAVPHSLYPPPALGEPYVSQATSEQPPLAVGLRQLAERSQAAVDDAGVHALAIVGATDLPAPAPKRRHPQRLDPLAPGRNELGLRLDEGKLDPPALATGGRDRRIGVRDQLGDDLHEVEAALGEVLAEVTTANAAPANLAWLLRDGHPRVSPAPSPSLAGRSASHPMGGRRVG